jgi:hypothetical protein
MRTSLRNATVSIAALLLLAGCSKPRVDGRSDDSLKASVEKVRASVPENQRDEFDKAIATVGMSKLSMERILSGNAAAGAADVREALNGKTAAEIFAMAKSIEEQRQREQRETDLKEVAALEKERAAADVATTELAKFEVLRAKFSTESDSIGMSHPHILLTVKNGTAHAVSRAFFHGVIASPGRSVPWVSEDFNYTIPGGLNPGEEASWNLTPNSFSSWGTVQVPADAGLQVTVVRLNGPNAEELYSTEKFTDRDKARLAALKQQYGKQ